MRKRTFAALILTAALLAPIPATFGCNKEEIELPPTQETPVEPSEPDTSETPENPSIPPTQETPPENGNLGNNDKEETPPDNSIVKPNTQKAEYIRCTGDSVNVRAGAGTSYAVLGSAQKGEIYALVEKSGGWYKTYYRGQVAYLSASYGAIVSMEKSKNADVEKVLNEGYRVLGVPYVYGAVRLHDGQGKLLNGFTAQKFDCSSLVQYVFYKGADTLLQVNTRTQVKQGTYVARDNLQRGDCMFFTNESRQHLSGIERVGHVAIYLGDNYILHTASDYARIEKITANRWRFYIESRRFV